MKNHTIEEKLDACMKTRSWVAQSFHSSLRGLLQVEDKVSESLLRDCWLGEMRKKSHIYPDGWYLPPPNGIGVLFGTEDNYERMNYKSLRTKEMHPKDDIYLDRKKGVIYVYASPVDKETGTIGDFGLTIYFGTNQNIQKHLKKCLELNYTVFNHAQSGMPFSQLTKFATQLFVQEGLSNEITSITDPASVNIGHTVPGSYEMWSEKEVEIFCNNNWLDILKMISSKRKFLSAIEPLKIHQGMAFTIEQRLTSPINPHIPMSSFHTIAIINSDGTKKLLTNFNEIFQLVGMNYMLEN